MSNQIEVTVAIDGKRITLSGPEDFVRTEVRRLTDLLTRAGQENAPDLLTRTGQDKPSSDRVISEKVLVEQKRPRSQAETVAVLGFALAESGQAEFSEEDMRRAYIRAGVRPPPFVGQALRDARNKNDFIAKGSKRGTYKLSAHGERTVRFDLPRTEVSARP